MSQNQNAAPELARTGQPVELYQELGHITRHLHDTLAELGVMPGLQKAAHGLPDARSRLNYVADKTAEAAHRVLGAVESAKAVRERMARQSEHLRHIVQKHQGAAVPATAVLAYLAAVEEGASSLDAHLTDIMLAQDFHDLTGQVVRKVLEVATAMEDSLVQLLVQAAPGELEAPTTPTADSLQGPVVAGTRQGDVVTDQGEVDDLLASLGF